MSKNNYQTEIAINRATYDYISRILNHYLEVRDQNLEAMVVNKSVPDSRLREYRDLTFGARQLSDLFLRFLNDYSPYRSK